MWVCYIYIYAFSRRFYPKRLTVHLVFTFFCQYVWSLGIEPTTFCAANAMLYHWATGTHGWYGCTSVVCMRVIKKCVCSCQIWERETLQYITNPTTGSTSRVLVHIMGKIWFCAQTKSYFEISTSNLENNFVFGFDFLAGLEFNAFHI